MKTKSTIIREAISTIPTKKLASIKPKHIYELLMKNDPDIEINNSFKSMTSTLLR